MHECVLESKKVKNTMFKTNRISFVSACALILHGGHQKFTVKPSVTLLAYLPAACCFDVIVELFYSDYTNTRH